MILWIDAISKQQIALKSVERWTGEGKVGAKESSKLFYELAKKTRLSGGADRKVSPLRSASPREWFLFTHLWVRIVCWGIIFSIPFSPCDYRLHEECKEEEKRLFKYS